jgi:hypothetical protein
MAWGSNAGLAVLVGTFLIYAVGAVAPLVPHERLPELWTAPAADFLRAAGIAPGWDWARFTHHGDILNLIGIAALAFCPVPCLAAVLPLYGSGRQWALFTVCALELAVLLVAATGVVNIH